MKRTSTERGEAGPRESGKRANRRSESDPGIPASAGTNDHLNVTHGAGDSSPGRADTRNVSNGEGLRWARRETLLLVLAAIAMSVVVYREALWPGNILFTSDDNIGHVAQRKAWLPAGFWRLWDDSIFAGQPGMLNLNATNFLLWLLPVGLFHRIIHGFDLAIASIGFGLFLRARGISLGAALLGALTAFWLGSTFFLTYAGHIGKFGVVMFAGLAVWLIERTAQTRSAAWGTLAGAACGAMFLEQADVALFFSMVLGPYALFALAREGARGWQDWLRPLLPMGVAAGALAYRALWLALAFFALEPADGGLSKEEIWDYCTQWSWPPEETIEWLAPGYYGWRSGEVEGPYWGRLGRSKEWETTRQGFMNFKLETFYLGGIPLAFAVLGLLAGLQSGGSRKADAIFWSAAAVVTFVLGCGKFTPVYRLFFELPGISSIRAPVKFMQVTQFALGVLSAFGLQTLIEQCRSDKKGIIALFSKMAGVIGGLLIIAGLIMATNMSSAELRFAQKGWGRMAAVIAENRVWAIVHGGFMLAAAATLAWAMRSYPSLRWAWIGVGAVALDQLIVSRHYVKTVPSEGYIEANPVVQLLQQRLGQQRVFLAGQDALLSHWLNIVFPYHRVAMFNAAQLRMDDAYRQFFERVGNRLDRSWQYFAVGYVVGPAQIWPDLERSPAFKGRFALEYAFNAFPQYAGFRITPATAQQPGQYLVARHHAPSHRHALIYNWIRASGQEALAALASEQVKPLETVVVPPDADLPSASGRSSGGSLQVLAQDTGFCRLRVATDQTAILRIADKYSRYWRARLNGQPIPVIPCDFLFVGALVPPGLHTIEFEHAPPRLPLYVQLAGMAVALGAAVIVAAAALRRNGDWAA